MYHTLDVTVIMHSVNCFIFFRSVNFKFVPEKVFISKELAIALLILHLTTLLIFAHKWLK
jgi:alpha-1,3-mannosyltransferase